MKKKLVPFALLFTYLLPLVGCGSKTCTITFDPNNGEETFSITVNKGELLPEPESPEKTAYDFKAWRFNNIKWSFKYEKVQNDMTLVAYYTPTNYSVSYDFGSAFVKDYLKSYNIETRDDFADIHKPGYILDHWLDQDGNILTKPEGNYGDKVLTPVWATKENNIALGSYPSIPVLSESLHDSLEEISPSSDYVGYLTYNNKRYYRFLNKTPKNTNDGVFDKDTYQFLECETATWLKVIESTEYDVYFSNFTLGYYHHDNAFSASQGYAGSKLDEYLNNEFANNLFTEEEKSKLCAYDIGSGATSKIFLPSLDEYNGFKSKLTTSIFDDDFYVNLKFSYVPHGIHLIYPYTGSCLRGAYSSNFYTGSYCLRDYYVNNSILRVMDGGEITDYEYRDFNLRPCIAIKK